MSDCALRLTELFCVSIAVIFTALPLMFWQGKRAGWRHLRDELRGSVRTSGGGDRWRELHGAFPGDEDDD